MSGEIVQTRSPGIGWCPVPAPPLPDLAIEAVIGERPYSYAIGTHQGGMNVDHVDLGIGIARVDADINVDLEVVVAVGHLKTVKHDAKHIVFRHKLKVQAGVVQPIVIGLGKGEVSASIEAFCLIER